MLHYRHIGSNNSASKQNLLILTVHNLLVLLHVRRQTRQMLTTVKPLCKTWERSLLHRTGTGTHYRPSGRFTSY